MSDGSDLYKPYLKECNENFQMHIYKLLYALRAFLLRSAQNYKKSTFFGQFKDHNSRRQHENETNDPIFFICFFRFNCLYIHFCNWK